jgi:hypothetical protein
MGRNAHGRGGVGMAMGSLVLGVVGRNLLVERGGGRLQSQRWRQRWQGQRHRQEACRSCQRAAEQEERGSRQCQQEGRTIPCKTLGEFGSRGNAGVMMMLAFKIYLFINLSRILSSAKTSLNLLKCMYSHCIICLKLALLC